MNKAIGYIRVSTSGQAVDGVSLEAQESKIKAWCLLNDYELDSIHTDAGISGSKMDNRPGLKNALSLCTDGTALVFYSLSRLARSTSDTIAIADRLKKSKSDMVSISEKIDTTSAAGKMIFRLMAVMSEFERDQVSERTKAAMSHLRNTGKRTSLNAPFGYRVATNGKDLVADDTQLKTIDLMVQLRSKGDSYRKIGKYLDQNGYPSQSGKPWAARSVQRVIERAR